MTPCLLFLFILSFFWQTNIYLRLPESLVVGRRIDYLSPAIYLADILFFLLLTLLFIKNKPAQRIKILPLLLGITIGAICWLWRGGSPLTLYFLLRLLMLGSVVWLVKHQINQERLLIPIGLGVIMVGLLTAAQFFLQKSVGGILYFLGERTFSVSSAGVAQAIINGRLFLRPYATFPHPNVLGGILCVLLPFLYLSSNPKSPTGYYLLQAARIFIWLGIFLSFSRSAWLVAVAITCLIFLTKKTASFFWVGVATILGLTILIFIEVTIGRFGNLVSVDNESFTERKRLAEIGIQMWEKSPLVGVGLGKFISQIPQYQSPPYLLQPIHSIYLQVLVETGVVGLGLFLLIIGMSLKKALAKKRTAVVLAWLATLVLGAVDHYFVTLVQPQLFLALLIGLSLG